MEESRNDRLAVLREEEGSGDDDDLAEADTEGRESVTDPKSSKSKVISSISSLFLSFLRFHDPIILSPRP